MWKCKNCGRENDFEVEFENCTFIKDGSVKTTGYIINVTCPFCERCGDDLSDVAEWVEGDKND